jgi:hypothetical protein
MPRKPSNAQQKKARYRRTAISHAIGRAVQRYGQPIGRIDIDRINHLIRSGQAKKLRSFRKRRMRTAYLVYYRDVLMACMYDRKLKTVITFLPPHDSRIEEEYVLEQERLGAERLGEIQRVAHITRQPGWSYFNDTDRASE